MKKNIKYKLLTMLMCTALLMSCSTNTGNETPVATNEESENKDVNLNIKTLSESTVEYEDDDFYTNWEDQNPNYINLNNTSASLEGTGAVINESTITINSPGTYVISGTLDDGQIIVDAGSEDVVRLVLNGAEINCSDNAPIFVKSAGKAVISLQDGTENTVSDGSTYVLEDAESDEPNAAIFSKDDLTINGTGTLTVNANYNNGIFGKDDLKITGGNIIINSVDDGLLGRDLVAVKDVNITINSDGDGIKSTNDTDADKGIIVLENGEFTITSGADGIQAETSLTIADGKYTINSTDDSIHSNNIINIAGGDYSISSEDDGIHADSSIDISGGTINILKSYEGIESAVINIYDGDIQLVAQDDGINVAGGNDGSSVNGRPGQNTFTSSGDYKLNITGGYIYVDAAGDGLDANGSIYMSGGTVIVNGPTFNGNGALDYDQTFEITGGLLIAAGSSGMVQTPSEQSIQNSVLINYSQVQKAGSIVNISDSSGNSLITFAPSKDYQAILVSSPDLTLDSTYQLYTGGTSTGSETNGLYAEGIYENGTKTADFTISQNVLSISETGEAVSSGGFNQMPGQRGSGKGGMKPEMPSDAQGGERPEMPAAPSGTAPDSTSGATQNTAPPEMETEQS